MVGDDCFWLTTGEVRLPSRRLLGCVATLPGLFPIDLAIVLSDDDDLRLCLRPGASGGTVTRMRCSGVDGRTVACDSGVDKVEESSHITSRLDSESIDSSISDSASVAGSRFSAASAVEIAGGTCCLICGQALAPTSVRGCRSDAGVLVWVGSSGSTAVALGLAGLPSCTVLFAIESWSDVDCTGVCPFVSVNKNNMKMHLRTLGDTNMRN